MGGGDDRKSDIANRVGRGSRQRCSAMHPKHLLGASQMRGENTSIRCEGAIRDPAEPSVT